MVMTCTKSEFVNTHCVIDERGCGPSVWASLREFLRRQAGASVGEWARSVRYLCIGENGQLFLETVRTDVNFQAIAELLQRWLGGPGAAMGVSGLEFVRFDNERPEAGIRLGFPVGVTKAVIGHGEPGERDTSPGHEKDRLPVARAM